MASNPVLLAQTTPAPPIQPPFPDVAARPASPSHDIARAALPAPSALIVPAPSEPPTRPQAQDGMRAGLEAIRDRADEAARRRRYRAAAEQARLLLDRVGASSNGALRAEFEPRANDLIDLAKLFADAVALVPTMQDRTWELARDLTGRLEAANEDSIEVRAGAAFTRLAWVDIAPARIVDLFRRAGNRDPYALAVFCFDNALEAEGSKALHALIKREPAAETRAFDLIARTRGMSLPEGGFAFHRDRWLTCDENREALLQERIDSLAARVRSGRNDEVSGAVKGIESALAEASPRPEFAERARGIQVAALGARREALLERLRNQPAMLSLERQKALKRELNAARAEAHRTIFDTKVYPDEDHGRVGQPAVDQAVRKVRELWEKPADAVAGSDAACRETLAAVQELDVLLQALGAKSGPDDGLDRTLAALSERIGVRTVALDDQEQGVLDHNRRVWAYNAKVESSMTPEERRVVTLVNEYREMMGLKILEFDDALAKAARGHSEDMEARSYFEHNSLDGRGPADRCFAAGYPRAAVGENIAMGMSRPEEAHDGWYNSSGHHRNMLQAMWTQMGCGRSGAYWTEDFGGAPCRSK